MREGMFPGIFPMLEIFPGIFLINLPVGYLFGKIPINIYFTQKECWGLVFYCEYENKWKIKPIYIYIKEDFLMNNDKKPAKTAKAGWLKFDG